MSDTRQHPILNYLRRVLGTAADGGVSDAELLRRYVHQRDEAAFELLLWRHAAMVLHVCRRLLRETDVVEHRRSDGRSVASDVLDTRENRNGYAAARRSWRNGNGLLDCLDSRGGTGGG